MLPSGKQALFTNRIRWTRLYLIKAGLITSPGRGQLILTEEGKKALPDADRIDNCYLLKYPSFQLFMNKEDNSDGELHVSESTVPEERDKSPEEILEDAYAELNTSLAKDLII